MPLLRIALRVPVGRPLPDVAAFVTRCEQAGFDGVGIHDHPSSGRDAYMALALAARATQRLRLFPATSSPVVRHPLVLASLTHSLEEIAPGRTCLTAAPGFISTRSIGQPRARVGFMRDAIRDLRRLLAGEEVAFGPVPTRLRNHPSASNLRWLRECGFDIEEAHNPAAIPEDRAHQIADAFGLFGSLERCAERLLCAREEAGIEEVFLFPAHDRGWLRYARGRGSGF